MHDHEDTRTDVAAQPDRSFRVHVHPRAAAYESAHRTGDWGRLAADSMTDIENEDDHESA